MASRAARHLQPVKDEPQRIWRLIDPATGDFKDYAACPTCKETNETLEAQTHKYHAALAEITRLKKDPQAEAEKHKLYAEAETVHTWWRLATWHPQTKFEHEEFYQALPRLAERGPVGLLKAVAGIAFDPATKQRKNGTTATYDGWHLLTDKAKCEDCCQRVPGGPESEEWKRWLVQRVETNMEATR